MPLQFKSGLIAFALITLSCAFPCLGQTPQPTPAPAPEQHTQENQGTAPAGEPLPDRQLSGSISGTVFDESGAVVAGARVKLTREGPSSTGLSSSQEALSDNDGQFSFANIAPGPFHLTITAAGFATQTSSGTLHSEENYVVPQIALAVATAVTDVEVGLSQTEVAEEEIKVEEKQRVLGVIPNFYVSYVPKAAPLTSKQKFELAWKMTMDPVVLVFIGSIAGVEQAHNDFRGYGQGAQGYGKRYGASYADFASGTLIGSALLPSLLRQDPRYFYKGTGSKASRFLYALASSVICKGDNGRWQTNYSNILGDFAAGGISNLYYPAKDRQGAALTFETGLIGIGTTSAMNLVQEFFMRKLTPKVPNKASNQVPNHDPAQP